MEKPTYKELLKHPIILSSAGLVILIAVASVFYYANSTRVPDIHSIGGTTESNVFELAGSGTVEPAENPDLAFAVGGRVTSVRVAVGEKVYQGMLLAFLDTSVLSAQRAQAEAVVAIQQAKLESLRSGSRPEDIAASQAALDKAKQDLANMYEGISDTSTDSYAKASDAVRTQLGQLFSNAETQNPKLAFTTSDSQAEINAESQRSVVSSMLPIWQNQLISIDNSTSGLEILLQNEISYLSTVRQLLNDISKALNSAPSLSASTAITYQTSVSTALNEINTATKNLNMISQNIASQKLAVAQLQSQLDLKRAGVLPSDIAAQEAQVKQAEASVDGINAQIRNEIIVAPFSGTVASVHIKTGGIVVANTPAISLNPDSPLQISVYFSEIDITKIHAGDFARVTLDAYGNERTFQVQVVSVDSAPSQIDSEPGKTIGYKVTLQFQESDPAITSGMTANITIPLTK